MFPTAFMFQNNEVRTYIDDSKSTWFCARDICNTLNITWNGKATLSSIKEKDKKILGNHTAAMDNKSLIYINEAGLYRFVSRSHKKEAEEFMSWIYEDVLPSIREKGWYGRAEIVDSSLLKNRLSIYEQKRKHIQSIKDTPADVSKTLIEDVHEMCALLGQKCPEIKAKNQIGLPLFSSEVHDK